MNRRTMPVTAALAATAALLLTACGSGDNGSSGTTDKPESSSKDRAKKGSAPSANPAASILTNRDVSGYRVKEPEADYAFAKKREDITLDKTACAPLAYAMNQFPIGSPQATATRVTSPKKRSTVYTYVTLSTYAAGKAEDAMADLAKAVDSCGNGFTAKAGANTGAYGSVDTDSPTATGKADGASAPIAFKATMKHEGITHTMRTEATRHGDTIALYFAVDGFAFTESRPGNAKIFPAVARAQETKLG